MAKIQARNVDDAIYQRIEQSAMKNERSLEGEIRIALREYYSPPTQNTPVLSRRERWQQETGQRLQWLFDRLTADRYFTGTRQADTDGIPELIRVARRLDRTPGQLMDCLEGHQALTFDLADTIATTFDARADWLLSGEGTPFPVERIGNGGYQSFLLPEASDGQYTFEFIRIAGGRHNGTLIILRQETQTRHLSLGVVTEAFSLARGMGSGGHGNLKDFLVFVKTHSHRLAINTYTLTPDDPDVDFWSVLGQHHPVWFQAPTRREPARWLQQLINGDDPEDWFTGWTKDLADIKAMPFGEQASADNMTTDTL